MITLTSEQAEELKRIVAQHPALMAQLYQIKVQLAEQKAQELIKALTAEEETVTNAT